MFSNGALSCQWCITTISHYSPLNVIIMWSVNIKKVWLHKSSWKWTTTICINLTPTIGYTLLDTYCKKHLAFAAPLKQNTCIMSQLGLCIRQLGEYSVLSRSRIWILSYWRTHLPGLGVGVCKQLRCVHRHFSVFTAGLVDMLIFELWMAEDTKRSLNDTNTRD